MTQSIFFDLAIFGYILGCFAYLFWAVSGKRKIFGVLSPLIFFTGAVFNAIFIVLRWIKAGHPPFTNTFEVMVFFSFAIAVTYLIFELLYKIKFLGGFASLLSLIILAYASILFESEIQPIVPALQNNFWLTIHVIFCFAGYASFAVSFIVALIHLIGNAPTHRNLAIYIVSLTITSLIITVVTVLCVRNNVFQLKPNWVTVILFPAITLILAFTLWHPLRILILKFNIHKGICKNPILEHLVYKTVAFGFPFLGIGIITGSVWANEAWGSYWSWDPKETWSLITWLIYFLFLHLRFIKGWRGAKVSWFSIIGFFAVIFTFFGVNYLLSGLHSYT